MMKPDLQFFLIILAFIALSFALISLWVLDILPYWFCLLMILTAVILFNT